MGPAKAAPAETTWWRQILGEPLALGLAVVVILRPVRDGVTYPAENAYYLWALVALFTLWAVRLLLRGEAVRFGKPILLLAGFLGVAALTAVDTVQFDATYRTLLIWAGHLFLFILATNGLRSKTAIGIVLGSFVAASLGETIWSIVHYQYVLPYTRQRVLDNPGLLRQYFGAGELTWELAQRLNANRAFGSLLFANALAAFLILGIPYLLGQTVQSSLLLSRALREWRQARKRRRGAGGLAGESSPVPGGPYGKPSWRLVKSVLVGVAAWFVALLVSYSVVKLATFFEYGLVEWTEHPAPWIIFVHVLPVVMAAGSCFLTRRYGGRICWLVLCAGLLPMVCVAELICLWLTYSRGGILALVIACCVGGALLWRSHRSAGARIGGRAAKAGLVALLVLFVAAAANLGAHGSNGPARTGGTRPAVAQRQGNPKPRPKHIGPRIIVDGVDLTLRDLANPASLRLRLSYWRTGLIMAKENFWTGVGFGNFGTVYPKYLYRGGGEVRTAHNDFLQALCETGVFGFTLFSLFWLYFFIWGALRILREQDRTERWLLAGLFTGVLAFLIHSGVDFNFFNPTLAFFAVLLAGVFFARASLPQARPEKRAMHQLMAVPLLSLAMLVLGASLRAFVVDYVIGGRHFLDAGGAKVINKQFTASEALLKAPKLAADRSPAPLIESVAVLSSLIPDPAALKTFGEIRVFRPRGPQAHRSAPTAILTVTDPELARRYGKEATEQVLEELEAADEVYPYSPVLAARLFQWYDLLRAEAQTPDEKREYTLACLRWAQETVERSPAQSLHHSWLGRALWLRAEIEPDRLKAAEYYREGLAEYKEATEFYPTSDRVWQEYGAASTRYGEAMKAAGQAAAGEAYITEGREARARARELKKDS